MKTIMISIQPQWVEKILNGEKTIEIRKTMPKCELPVKVYIYCTNGKMLHDMKNQDYWDGKRFAMADIKSNDIMSSSTPFANRKVVAEFTLNKVDTIEINDPYIVRNGEQEDWWWFKKNACLDSEQIMNYIGYGNEYKYSKGYAWHIDDLKIYDTPKRLIEFRTTPDCFNTKNIEFKENAFGEFVPQYHDNSFCKVCKYYDGDWGDCKKTFKPLTRPPQSWCYVEEI